MRKTHTFIGMTSGKEAFRLVQCLYTLPGSLCTGVQSLYKCTARGWGQSLMECRTEDSSDINTRGHCSFRFGSVISDHPDDAALEDVSRLRTQSVGHRDNDGQWCHPQWCMMERKDPVCDHQYLKCDSVNDSDKWRADNLLIPVWAWSGCLGYLSLITGWYHQAIITSVTLTRCDLESSATTPRPRETRKTQNGKH